MRLLLVPAAVAALLAYTPTRYVAAQPSPTPAGRGPGQGPGEDGRRHQAIHQQGAHGG